VKEDGDSLVDCPVAFASAKLTTTQQRWAVIEKGAYAALWGGGIIALHQDIYIPRFTIKNYCPTAVYKSK
jgi:RNase H-like domain found in reverse transcriptase